MTSTYDIALINFYDGDARMGMHRDSDEKSDAPVVSLSLGDTCVFRFGNTDDADPPVHGRRAAQRRPVRVRRPVPARLPRGSPGARRARRRPNWG